MSDLSPSGQLWRERGRMLDLLGLQVFVLDTLDSGPADSDEAVLLLHGFPSSSLDYHRILPALGGRRAVLLDLPGFGFSRKPTDYSYSLHEQADVVLGALRALGVKAAHVVAHDMGTSVACELLARRERHLLPIALRSLVLMNGSVHIELAHLTPSQQLLRSPLGPIFARLGSRALFRRQLLRILARPVPDEDLDDMWQLICHDDGRLRLPQTISYIRERHLFWHRWVGALTRLDLPALILWGTEDPVAVRAIAERLAGEIPGARLEWLQGIGHYPQLEDPAAVGRALNAFLDGGR